jgi:hypothetical protein
MVRIKALFAKNPVAWILAALLIGGLYGNYTLGQTRTKLCDLIPEPLEWSTGAGLPMASDGSFDADAWMKQFVQESKQLATEDSLKGEVWRWQEANREQIDKICAEPETRHFPFCSIDYRPRVHKGPSYLLREQHLRRL